MEYFLVHLLYWLPTIILATTTAVMIWRDPRRMRCAIFLGLTLLSLYGSAQPLLFSWLHTMVPDAMPWVLLAILLLAFLLVVGVALFLVWAGVVLVVREGASVSHSLSLALGLGLFGYMAAGFVSAISDNFVVVMFLLFLGMPILTFGFALFSYLLYSGLYGAWAKRWAPAGEVVVVLGSGLIGDKVPPLLARRLDLGLAMYARSLLVWPAPVLVVSGGKGHDEQISEAEGMRRYVESQGIPQVEGALPEVILEDKSVSTEQNLAFTRVLIDERGLTGPWMAVTSDFHSFRAAMLLSVQGIPGNAVGAHSVRYFWASAKLREFIAILAAHSRWTVAFTILSTFPLAAFTIYRLFFLISGS